MKHCLIILVLFSSLALAGQPKDPYDQWLNGEGMYLLSAEQKQYFRGLNDAEKQAYIDNVWASLDPNPITPENEFKVEYKKRYEYAKEHFGVPSDRAKIYILLGAPNSIESYANSDKYYPLELWSYFSLGVRNLPPSLDLIFFKRWGVGDYRLFSPIFDGMKALTPSQIDFDNPRNRQMLNALFDASVVQASQRVTPGASVNESEEVRLILQDPDALPKLETKRPTVETTIVYEGFSADVYVYPKAQDDGTFLANIAMAIPPKYLTFENSRGDYEGRVDLIGKITDEKGNEIARLSDSPPLKMTNEEFEKAKNFTFTYLFAARLLPGKYNLDCVFRDYLSNSAGRLEKSFEILPDAKEMELLPPLVAYKTGPAPSDDAPFVFGKQQFFPKENGSFSRGQAMAFYTEIKNPAHEKLEGDWLLEIALQREGKNALDITENMPIEATTSNYPFARRVKLESLTPGAYTLLIKLTHEKTVLTSETPLRISTEPETLGRIRVVSRDTQPPENMHANLALQYYLKGQLADAARHARIALDFNPSSYAARSLTARIQKANGNSKEAIAAFEKLLQESPGDSEGNFLLGKWYLEESNWAAAADRLGKALNLGYNTVDLLNGLARAQVELGNTKQAIDYWEKSLALDKNQPEVQKLLSQYRK